LTSDDGFMTASLVRSSLLPRIPWKMANECKVENRRKQPALRQEPINFYAFSWNEYWTSPHYFKHTQVL